MGRRWAGYETMFPGPHPLVGRCWARYETTPTLLHITLLYPNTRFKMGNIGRDARVFVDKNTWSIIVSEFIAIYFFFVAPLLMRT